MPIGAHLDPDPATNAWRHIYWYAARPVGDTNRDESRMTEEEDRKKFSTFWFSETDAISRLKLEDEKFSKPSFTLISFLHTRA